MDRACPPGLQRPLEKFDSARLSPKKKKANFVNRRKLLFRGYTFIEIKHDRFGKDVQRPRLRRSKIDRRRRTWTPPAGRSGCLFFFFLPSSNNFRFAFLALNVAIQAFSWKISICPAKSNHVLRCSLSGELACGQVPSSCCIAAAADLQLNRKSSALPSAGFVRRLESWSWKVRLGPQSYSICLCWSKWKFFFVCWTLSLCSPDRDRDDCLRFARTYLKSWLKQGKHLFCSPHTAQVVARIFTIDPCALAVRVFPI